MDANGTNGNGNSGHYNNSDVAIGAMRTEVKYLTEKFDRFIESSDRRFQQIEAQQDSISARQGESGKTNWTALGVLFTAIGALAVLYVAPVKTAQEATDNRLVSAVSTIHEELRQLEGDRRRDEDKFDERLQREMRLLNDTVTTSGAATKEMLLGRLTTDETRINDVTQRVDVFNDDERRELHNLWDAMPIQKLRDSPISIPGNAGSNNHHDNR